jgi:tetrahydromethanopterin S-methyltransferase subunit B
MANPQLVEYIKTVQGQGFPESTIREVLAKNGWQSSDVNEALESIKRMEEALQMTAPMAPGGPALKETPATEGESQKIDYRNPVIEYNSPFSLGLAVVLFISLLILINKMIDDSAISTATINGKLIFDALVILPFLLVAFILHGGFASDNKRYAILSQPYFVASALLVCRLLWDTSVYIWNTNATYGVYIVLVLIIVVLTSIILFVQKYIKN